MPGPGQLLVAVLGGGRWFGEEGEGGGRWFGEEEGGWFIPPIEWKYLTGCSSISE
jgi:hypothetical protein